MDYLHLLSAVEQVALRASKLVFQGIDAGVSSLELCLLPCLCLRP